MSVGQDEAVPIGPLRFGGVVPHDPGEEHMGHRGESHGRPGVAGVGRPGGVHGQAADDVDAELVEPVGAGGVGHGQQRISHRGQPYRSMVTWSTPGLPVSG